MTKEQLIELIIFTAEELSSEVSIEDAESILDDFVCDEETDRKKETN